MKASELIAALRRAIQEHGDLETYIEDDNGVHVVTGVAKNHFYRGSGGDPRDVYLDIESNPRDP